MSIEAMSMYSIMLIQFLLVGYGGVALFRLIRGTSRVTDLIATAIGLVAATQLNITLVRMRYGATVVNYNNPTDWTASNFVGAICMAFLLYTIFATKKALR